ncbi:MAG: Gfo/Idh/MocA family oxidoreductase [Candidatus Lokiarchaeota archaeon]
MQNSKNFVLIGVGGYVAPRHLKAIYDTNNNLDAAYDINDSVGVLDKYFMKTKFFNRFELLDRYLYKLLSKEGKRIDYISICSPNWLHDYHIRFALRNGANAICEKPLVINPWNLDFLEKIEKETGKSIYCIHQLRLHPSIIELKKKIETTQPDRKYDVVLTYITPRGPWYYRSWKGDESKSGGIAMNIGIHFFDMLLWIFGSVVKSEVYLSKKKKMSGFLELEKANIRWFLSTDNKDLPTKNHSTYRSIKIDNKEFEFSKGFTNLHTEVYRKILNGEGLRIKDVRPSVELIYKIRNSNIEKNIKSPHPFLKV